MEIKIIGLDCATDPQKTGIALGMFDERRTKLEKAQIGKRDKSVVKIIADWIDPNDKVLIAIDAPLGWPTKLGNELVKHIAGKRLKGSADDLFSRLTDKTVRKKLDKKPLDVGANLIARTAHIALEIIEQLGKIKKLKIQLAWNKNLESKVSVIEVYPAGTLKAHKAHGFPSTGYKKPGEREARKDIIKKISKVIEIPKDLRILEDNADALDAAICVLAAHDFLRGNVIEPENIELAKKEGWIWVKKPSKSS